VLERAAIVARGQDIQSAHLDFEAPGPGSLGPLGDRLEALERGELARALELHGGNKAEVARALGIQRTTLYYRLKKLGLDS
jgi:DNA-binding NtrC family response regulator